MFLLCFCSSWIERCENWVPVRAPRCPCAAAVDEELKRLFVQVPRFPLENYYVTVLKTIFFDDYGDFISKITFTIEFNPHSIHKIWGYHWYCNMVSWGLYHLISVVIMKHELGICSIPTGHHSNLGWPGVHLGWFYDVHTGQPGEQFEGTHGRGDGAVFAGCNESLSGGRVAPSQARRGVSIGVHKPTNQLIVEEWHHIENMLLEVCQKSGFEDRFLPSTVESLQSG